MKNNIFILLLVAISGLFYSCESDVVPTQDIVEYDDSKVPVIVSKNDLTNTAVIVGDDFNWGVEIEAYNGIESISLNGDVLNTFGNGQIKYSRQIIIEMPDKESHDVSLVVEDERGLKTTMAFAMTRGKIQSPYIISDFIHAEASIVGKTSATNVVARRVLLPKYTNNYATQNFVWFDGKVESDINATNIRFGSPGFNGGANAGQGIAAIHHDDWEELAEFGATAPAYEDETETKALRFNLFPRKGKMKTMFALDAPLNVELITDVVDNETRVFKVDVYVKTTDGANHPFVTKWSGNLTPLDITNSAHSRFALGLSSTSKFFDTAPKTGQDHGMIATLTEVDKWETLTFQFNAAEAEEFANILTTGDVENDEVDMLILAVSPTTTAEKIPNATYYFKNLRIETVE